MRPAHTLVGIGLRPAHVDALLAQRPRLGFLEVHAENAFAAGGAFVAALETLAQHYPISLHGVGLSLGSAHGVDEAHLDRLCELVARIRPVRVSDHLAFSSAGSPGEPRIHAGDLLPVARTPASVEVLVANIQHAQARLGRSLLVENLSAYLGYTDDALSEQAFCMTVCQRAGCQLLLDLNNLVVNGLNRARRAHWQHAPDQEPDRGQALLKARAEALDFVWSLPPGLVGEVHLAGFRWPEQPDRLVVDDHSQRVSPTVWDCYEQTLNHLGELPTLVEWDLDLPPLAVLLDEARIATQTIARLRGELDEDEDTPDA
jgi:uncharacterized protein (UPF0276 family)